MSSQRSEVGIIVATVFITKQNQFHDFSDNFPLLRIQWRGHKTSERWHVCWFPHLQVSNGKLYLRWRHFTAGVKNCTSLRILDWRTTTRHRYCLKCGYFDKKKSDNFRKISKQTNKFIKMHVYRQKKCNNCSDSVEFRYISCNFTTAAWSWNDLKMLVNRDYILTFHPTQPSHWHIHKCVFDTFKIEFPLMGHCTIFYRYCLFIFTFGFKLLLFHFAYIGIYHVGYKQATNSKACSTNLCGVVEWEWEWTRDNSK